MKFKDVLAIVTSQAQDEHVLAFGEQLAIQNSGHLSGIVVNWMPALPLAVEGYVVDPMWSEMVGRIRKDLKSEALKVKQRIDRNLDSDTVEPLLLEFGAARPIVGTHARHADVSIVGRPTKTTSDSSQAILEGPLFESGRPIIVVPPEWRTREIGQSVLVCWKPTREAARALGDAEDFLAGADRVTLVTVDAKPSETGYGAHPGSDISAHLARRGVKVELINLDTAGRSETKAIQDQALATDADLIVMGGYGRSRMSEFIFGGVTREMLKTSTFPVLMAH